MINVIFHKAEPKICTYTHIFLESNITNPINVLISEKQQIKPTHISILCKHIVPEIHISSPTNAFISGLHITPQSHT